MMEPTTEQLAALARQLAATAPEEIDCDEVLDRIGRYLETCKAGADLPAELVTVGQHLDICPSCREEYEALLRAFRDDGD
jgi:predicted anti-sigma-YlaC factor YlaD